MRNWLVWQKGVWLETAVFLMLFAIALGSIDQLSPTFDEQSYITRGLAYLRNESRYMRVGHPLGLNALNASLLVSDETVHLPTSDPSWQLPNFHRPSELFLWEIGNDVEHIMFLARLPTIWLGMLLMAMIGRWVWELTYQRWAVLLALALAAFDPNLLAHMRLATTDFGLAAFAFLAGFLLWRFWKRPSWPRAMYAGIGFGLLQNSKFTAGLFVPLFGIVILILGWQWIKSRPMKESLLSWRSPLVMIVIAYPLAAFLTLWGSYGFQIGVMPANLPTMPQLSGMTLPLSHHLEQLLDIGGRLQKSTPSFLAGEYSDSGWWYYFPLAFLLKTPLHTLLLLLLMSSGLVWLTFKQRLAGQEGAVLALLVPSLGYFAIALSTDINLGYRHLLPMLPFLIVFIAVVLSWLLSNVNNYKKWGQVLSIGLLTWGVASAIWLYPNYLAFFNVFAGGPDGGWRYLVDSNLDWGQDLGNLKEWMDENSVDEVWLSYFGEGRPSYYDIHYEGLDSFPPRLMNPEARPFYPADPAPGTYAISATTLQGVHFANHDQFAWFRERQPLDKVGFSIFLYDVPPRGRQTDLLLSGVQLDDIAQEDFTILETNQVEPRWVDTSKAFLQPSAANFWLVVKQGDEIGLVETAVSLQPVSQTEQYILFQAESFGERPSGSLLFQQDAHEVSWIDVPESPQISNNTVHLTTRWRNQTGPVPLKIYVHMLDNEGQLVAQWDGLSIAWEGWQAGDILWQKHVFELPADLASGPYVLHAGLYNPETAVRWLTENGDDFVKVGTVTR